MNRFAMEPEYILEKPLVETHHFTPQSRHTSLSLLAHIQGRLMRQSEAYSLLEGTLEETRSQLLRLERLLLEQV